MDGRDFEHGGKWDGWKFSFNPEVYKCRLSPFGAEVLDTSLNSWISKELRKNRQYTETQYTQVQRKHVLEYNIEDSVLNDQTSNYCHGMDWNRSNIHQYNDITIVPQATDVILSNSKDFYMIANDIPSDTMERNLSIQPEKNVLKGLSPTIENVMLCLSQEKTKTNDQKAKIPTIEENIEWENMFDSEALFIDERNANLGLPLLNKTSSNVKTIKNGKLDGKLDKKKSKSTNAVELRNKNIPKPKLIQNKLTHLVPKKKNKATDKVLCKTLDKSAPKGLRKKPFTKAVKEWLECSHAKNGIKDKENHAAVNSSLLGLESLSSNDEAKSFQSKLVNVNGVLKFSHTVDASKFTIGSKKGISMNCENIHTKTDEVMSENIPNKEIIDIQRIELIDLEQSKAKMFKMRTNNDETTLEISPIRKCGLSIDFQQSTSTVENIKKKKPKFVAPVKSQVPVREIEYEVFCVNKGNFADIFENRSKNNTITITLFYENEFCQLSCRHTEENCVPRGLIIGLESKVFYCFSKPDLLANIEIRIQLRNFLSSNTKKICFEAKEIIIFAAETLNIHPNEITSGFLDVKVACFLMDPDKPPRSFFDVQNAINYTPEYTVATDDLLKKTAWYMILLDDCMVKIESILMKSSLWKIFVNMEMEILSILAGLQMRGLRVDIIGLNKIKDIILDRMKSVEQDCYKSAGKVFQINSPLQLRSILYEDLKLDSKSNIKIKQTLCMGAKSTSEAMLRSLADSHALPKNVLEYRHLHKALATFVTGIANHVRGGVVRGTWLQTAAATGRIACNNPNLQAIPKLPFELTLYPQENHPAAPTLQLRSVYVARESYVLLAADFQHVECRVFAHLAQDDALLGVFAKGGDFFRVLAEKWLNKPESEVSQEDREKTKRMVYASMYGAGTKKLMDILNTSYDQTLTVLSSFNNNRDLVDLSPQKLKLQRVCDRHFLPEHFYSSDKRRLLPNAVPTAASVLLQPVSTEGEQQIDFTVSAAAVASRKRLFSPEPSMPPSTSESTQDLLRIKRMKREQTDTGTFPSLKLFGQRVVERCRQRDGVLETLCGRRRNFHNIFSDNFSLKSQAERQAVNFMIQGSAADLCKAAMIWTERSLRSAAPPAACHLVLQIHDELVWEAALDDLERIRDLVKTAMESCGAACGLDLQLPVSISVGPTWANMTPC